MQIVSTDFLIVIVAFVQVLPLQSSIKSLVPLYSIETRKETEAECGQQTWYIVLLLLLYNNYYYYYYYYY